MDPRNIIRKVPVNSSQEYDDYVTSHTGSEEKKSNNNNLTYHPPSSSSSLLTNNRSNSSHQYDRCSYSSFLSTKCVNGDCKTERKRYRLCPDSSQSTSSSSSSSPSAPSFVTEELTIDPQTKEEMWKPVEAESYIANTVGSHLNTFFGWQGSAEDENDDDMESSASPHSLLNHLPLLIGKGGGEQIGKDVGRIADEFFRDFDRDLSKDPFFRSVRRFFFTPLPRMGESHPHPPTMPTQNQPNKPEPDQPQE